MSKILILSGSPQRDKVLDFVLKTQLEKLGNEVIVRPLPICCREAVMEYKPNVLVMPPIKNLFAFELAEVSAHWGVSVVIRHVEPGADEEDIKGMDPLWRNALLFRRPPGIKLELMWGETEVQYLKSVTGEEYPVIAVGAFVADAYKDNDSLDTFINKVEFCKKYGLDVNKKTILLSSPWGLFDMDSDLMGSSQNSVSRNKVAKDAWMAMAKKVKQDLGSKYNILATLHPGLLGVDAYEKELGEIGIPIDVRSLAMWLLSNCDILVHAGSTMAVEMHWLNKPSFQFGDVNSLDMPDKNWWQRKNSPISRISPFSVSAQELVDAISKCEDKSNCNVDTIKELESGRYGRMDGKATERAASLINKLDGKFEVKWPISNRAPQTFYANRDLRVFYDLLKCSSCGESFFKANQEFFKSVSRVAVGLKMPDQFSCPVCGGPLFSAPVKQRVTNNNYWDIANESRKEKGNEEKDSNSNSITTA